MKVILKKVGEEPKIVELKSQNDTFGIKREINEMLEVDNDTFMNKAIMIDEFEGVQLYINPSSEEVDNFRIEHMNKTIKGNCVLVKLSKNKDNVFESATEKELEIMRCIVVNDIKGFLRLIK